MCVCVCLLAIFIVEVATHQTHKFHCVKRKPFLPAQEYPSTKTNLFASNIETYVGNYKGQLRNKFKFPYQGMGLHYMRSVE